MRNVLVVSKDDSQARIFIKLLRPLRLNNIDFTNSAQEARRKANQNDYDIAIINTPLSHELGVELALDITENNDTDIILIAKRSDVGEIENRVYHEPVLLMERPLDAQSLLRNINFILNSQYKREQILKQNQKLSNNIKTLKDQFRAKLLLMEHLGMTEDEAHRYIQKQAMDNRKTPGEAARSIIRLYESK